MCGRGGGRVWEVRRCVWEGRRPCVGGEVCVGGEEAVCGR